MAREISEKHALGKVAKRGVVWSFLREGVTEILLFPASMVVSRLLTPAEFGITSAALFFIQLSSRLTDVGLNAALVRSKVVTQTHYTTVFGVNLLMGLLTYVVLTSAAPAIGAFYGTPETGQLLPIAAVSFLIAPFGAVPGAILTRGLRFRELSIVEWTFCSTFATLSMAFAWAGFSFWGLVYARVASVAAQVLMRIYFAHWRPSLTVSWPALQDVLSFGLGMHTRRLLDYGASNFDNLVVGKFMGMNALGLYDKAFSTVSRFLGRTNTGGPAVMFRIFSLIHEDPSRFRRAYSRVIMSATMFGFPVLAVMIVTAEHFMVVLFGPNWRPAAQPFQLLCVVGALKLVNSYASSATQAAGLVWSEVWRQVLYISLIVSGVFVFRAWGPTGAAAAMLAATATMTVLMHVLLRRVTHLGWVQLLQPIVPGLLCGAVAGGCALLVEFGLRIAQLSLPEWTILACQGLAAGLACAIFTLFAPHDGLRSLVHEVATDLAPSALKKRWWFQRYVRMHKDLAETAGAVVE